LEINQGKTRIVGGKEERKKETMKTRNNMTGNLYIQSRRRPPEDEQGNARSM